MKKIQLLYYLLMLFPLISCQGENSTSNDKVDTDNKAVEVETIESITKKAQQEGSVNSVGMPDTWANWEDTWADLETKFNIKHQDTDMSSGEEIAKFAAEKNDASADIGDVGISFGPIAIQKEVTLPYKTSYWDQIPQWAKDKDGHWIVSYTGTISFIINKKLVKDIPHSWADLKKGNYKISIGDVASANQAVNGVLAANYALGGTEADLTPALDFFASLAKQKRLGMSDPGIANLEKGEVEVGILWDFNALNYANQIDRDRFEIVIPADGSVISGYATIINKYAKHPNAAKLTREYILSEEGQLNLAKGYARPIRSEFISIPATIQQNLLPKEQYIKARPIKDFNVWEKTAKELPKLWQKKVLIHQQQ